MPTCVHAQSCPSLFDLTDCSQWGSPVHTIFPKRTLESVAISSSKGSSQPRNQTHISCVSCIGKWILYYWATWEAHMSTWESTKQILQRRICLLVLIFVSSIDTSTQEVFTKCGCCCSVAKSCPTLWYPMDCSTPGSSILHYLPEFAQIFSLSQDANLLILCHPPSFCLQSLPAPRYFTSLLFTSGG